MTPKSAIGKRPIASPLRYPGGKGALYRRLRQVIRNNDLAGCTYVEPFAGGAGAGLALLVTGQVSRVVVNDLDPAVHAFWKYLIDDSDGLQSRIANAKLTVKEWRRQKDIYMSGPSASHSDLGFATFYLNRTNRSGVLNGGPIGGLDQSGPYKIDARFNKGTLIDRVRVLGLYSGQINATRRDGLAVIKTYARRADTFVYVDPPYFEKAGSLYMNSFNAKDHERLAVALNDRADGAWLLTYDDVPQVHDLYCKRRRRRFSLNYSAHRVTQATEIVAISDALQDIAEGWTLEG